MKSAPGLRGLYPRPEQRGFTPLSVSTLTSLLLRPKLKTSKVTRVGKRAFLGKDTRGVVAGLLPFFRRRRRTDMGDRRTVSLQAVFSSNRKKKRRGGFARTLSSRKARSRVVNL